MLIIIRENGELLTRWVGQEIPRGVDVKFIQADGDELEHIKNLFENIPIRKNKPVVLFFGDIAKFIIENW